MRDTEPYKTKTGVILRGLLLTPSGGWPAWSVTAAGLSLMSIGSFVDVRWFVVGLMLCVAVVPCVVAFTYFSHVLEPGIVPNMIPHTLERLDNGYILRTWRRADQEDGEEADEWVETGTVRLEDANITSRKTSFEYETLYFKDSRMKILYVPRFKK
ncbi:MAG: hypothetical protein K2L00_01200 [Muribaculaceae bacterium]|nr:hypothetical protein [Muribaculaceae bacterium]